MPGWKARIGILSPSVFESPSDWDLILPSGFKLVASGLNVRGHTPEEFDKAIEALESALSVFVAEEVDAVLLGGITLATQRGYEAERQIVSSLSQRIGLPVTTAMEANVEALQHLNARNVVIATAYRKEINQAVRRYFEDAGLGVLGISGLEVSKPVDQVKLPEYASYRAALKDFKDYPQADAVLIHGRWSSVAFVEDLERDTGRPVVASTAASLWWALKTLNMKIPVNGYGRLLRQGAPET
jgi:maleate cis-trans isomerase